MWVHRNSFNFFLNSNQHEASNSKRKFFLLVLLYLKNGSLEKTYLKKLTSFQNGEWFCSWIIPSVNYSQCSKKQQAICCETLISPGFSNFIHRKSLSANFLALRKSKLFFIYKMTYREIAQKKIKPSLFSHRPLAKKFWAIHKNIPCSKKNVKLALRHLKI